MVIYPESTLTLPKIWIKSSDGSQEFPWNSKYLLCASYCNNQEKTISFEYLLLGKNGNFFTLITEWHLHENNKYKLKIDVLQVRSLLTYEKVIEWCKDKGQGLCLIRQVFDKISDAAQETGSELKNRLEGIAKLCQDASRCRDGIDLED